MAGSGSKISRRGFLHLCGLVAPCAVLVACTPKSVAPEPTAVPSQVPAQAITAPTEAPTEPPAVPSEAPKATTVVTMATSGDQNDVNKAYTALAGLKDSHPEIQPEVNLIAGEEFTAKTLAMVAAGTAPDIMAVGDDTAAIYVEKGAFLDLTAYINDSEHGIDVTKFYPEIYRIGVFNGKTYLLASDHTLLATHINTDLFDAAGIAYPKEGWTYDDLADLAQELTLDANGNNAKSPDFDPTKIKQWGADQASPWGTWYRFLTPIFYSFGATAISPDGTKATGYLDSQAMATALAYYRDLIHKYHCTPGAAQVQVQGGGDFFGARLSAIKLDWGPWSLSQYQADPALHFAIVPLPTGPAGHFGATCWAGYGVYSGSKHPLEAYLVVRELGTEPGQITRAEVGLSSMPSVNELTGKAKDPYWSVFMGEIPHALPPEEFRNSKMLDCITNPFTAQVLDLIVADGGGSYDPRPVLATLAMQADTCLAQQ